jgi:hypothetical protein
MQKFFISLIQLLPSFAFAQVYMHEAQDDAANSEPISILGIISFLILCGIVYAVCKLIGSAHSKHEQRKYEAYNAEYNRREKQENGSQRRTEGKKLLAEQRTD